MWRGKYHVYPEVGATEQLIIEGEAVDILSIPQAVTLATVDNAGRRWKWYVRLYSYKAPSKTLKTSLVADFEGVTEIGESKADAIKAAQEVKNREIEKYLLTEEERAQFEVDRQLDASTGPGGMSVREAIAMGSKN